MTMVRLLWHDYRYFPYERMLAGREAHLIFGAQPKEIEDGLLLKSKQPADTSASRLTYFKCVLIANAKIAAFNASPAVLQRECDALAARLDPIPDGSDWRKHLPEPDYLQKWFHVPVLHQLRAILRAIEETRPPALQDVFRVVLSDIIRA